MATFVENKKVRFNYEILETFDAGLELLGGEVKAVRKRQMSLEGSHVVIRDGEAYLVGATISVYQPNNPDSEYEADRNRRLLLSKKELKEIIGKSEQRGLTLVPISVYNEGRYLKLSIGLVRGKKKFDKRETLKKREAEREIGRSLKD